MTLQLLDVLGLPPRPGPRPRRPPGDGPENLADLHEDAELDEALRLVEQQKRLDALAANPRGATEEDALVLDEARRAAQAALSARDAAMAAREIDELRALHRDIAHAVEVRRAARKAALAERLEALTDPDGIAMLAANPLAALRAGIRAALEAGELVKVEGGIAALERAHAEAILAIEAARRERAAALRATLDTLQAPPDAEEAELAILLPLREAAGAAIEARRFEEALGRLDALKDAIVRATEAIAERKRLRLAAVLKLVDAFAPPKGVEGDESGRLTEALQKVRDVLGGGNAQAAEAEWLAFTRVLRSVQRAIQKRQELADKQERDRKEQDKRDEDQRKLKEEQGFVARLRAWIDTNIYTPNNAIKTTGGAMVDTPLADAFWDRDRLTQADHDAALLQLAGEAAAVAAIHALAQRVQAARALAPTRLADLEKKIARCDTLKKEMQDSTTTSIKRLGGKADLVKNLTTEVNLSVNGIDALKAQLVVKCQSLKVLNLLTVTCNPAQVALLNAAELVLLNADPAPCFANVVALKKSLVTECTAVELLDLGKAWVNRGLWYKTIQPILNLACSTKLPAGVFEARLRVAFAAQNVIEVGDVGSILGMAESKNLWVCGAAAGYLGVPCHLSLYKTVYKGGCAWSDPVDTILKALIGGTADNGLHITWEWTGERNEEHNLKCFRNGKASATGRKNYLDNVEGRLAADILAGDYTPVDIGGPYPYCATAITNLFNLLTAEIATLRARLVERCANRGLSNAEKAANTDDKLELPKL